MTEAELPDDSADSGGPRRRRSTFTPPPQQREVPLTLGDTPTEQPPTSDETELAASPADSVGPESLVPRAAPPLGTSTPQVAPSSPVAKSDSVLAPPERRSLSDEDIMKQMGGQGAESGALIAALEEQMALRQREQEEFDSWEVLIRQSFPEDEADHIVEQGRQQFEGHEAPHLPEPVDGDGVQASPDTGASEEEEVSSHTPAEASEDSGPIVLPRFGHSATTPVTPETDASDSPEDAAPLPPTGSFERVLVDSEDAPVTDAWPLAPPEEESPHPGPLDHDPSSGPSSAEQHSGDDDVMDALGGEVVAGVSVDSGGSPQRGIAEQETPEASISIREALATKPTPEVAFEDVQAVTTRPGGFDHLGAEPTPDNLRTDRLLQLVWAWWAVGVPVPVVLLGVWLVDSGLGTAAAILAGAAGSLLAILPLAIGARQGLRSGLPTLVSSRAAFGRSGNVLPALLMVIIRIVVAAAIVWAAAWVATGVLVESNYWNSEPALMHVILAAVFALVASGIAITGRAAVTVSVWVTAGLGALALVAVVLVGLEPLNSSALSYDGGSGAQFVAGVSVVMSVLIVFWAHFGGDLARFQRSSQSATGASLSPLIAFIPVLALLSWGVLLGASGDETRQALLADPFDTLLGQAPGWYPIPAILVGALPLVALAGLAMHSSSYAVLSVGRVIPRYVAATIAAGASALMAIAMVVFLPTFPEFVETFALLAGVVVAAWVGIFAGEVLTRRVALDPRLLLGSSGNFPRVRVAPLVGFIAAIALGWGLIDSAAGGFGWLGYLQIGLAQAGVADLAGWQLGPLVALVLSLAVASLAGIRAGVIVSAPEPKR